MICLHELNIWDGGLVKVYVNPDQIAFIRQFETEIVDNDGEKKIKFTRIYFGKNSKEAYINVSQNADEVMMMVENYKQKYSNRGVFNGCV